MYNKIHRSNPIRQDFLTVYSPAVMPLLHTARNAESVKGGMLMKSKYRANGEKIALCNFYYRFIDDNISHKSTVAAPLAQERLL